MIASSFLVLLFGMLTASGQAAEPVLWLDASNEKSLSLHDEQVQVWAAANPGGVELRQDNVDHRPAPGVKLNSRATLYFDGQDFLKGPPVLGEGDDTFTFIALWRPHRNGVQVIFEQAGGGSGRRASLLQVGSAYGFNGQNNDAHNLVPLKPNEWRLTALVVTGAEQENVIVIDNDSEPKVGTINIQHQNVGTDGIRVGNKLTSNGEFFHGDLAEIRIYDSALPKAELTRQLLDVRTRWGLTFSPKVPDIIEAKPSVKTVVSIQNLEPSAEQIEFFENKVRPLFARHCYKCHSAQAKKVKAKLYLDNRLAALKGSESGPVLVPGNPEASLLIKAVRYQEESREMPPTGKLSHGKIATLVQWVKMGAPWPKTDQDKMVKMVKEEEPYDWDLFRREHWSFKPIRKQAPPATAQSRKAKSPIDNFIFARLEEAGLKPSSPADKRTLIRRAYFDLIGLPPTPEAVEAFLRDESSDAFGKVIDELLASKHYGERWGRYWLDVARYSDGLGGFLDNGALPQAWRYRDWVIRSLNIDMPYNEFVRQQIAGDLLNRGDSKIGTGFFAVGPTYRSDGGDPEAKAQAEAETLADRVDTLSRAFLAMTVQCARCHNHKFDPITTKDYYALAGIFKNTSVTEHPLATKEEIDHYNKSQRAIKAQDAKFKKWIADKERDMQDEVLRNVSKYLLGHRQYLANLKSENPVKSPEEWARKNSLVDFIFKRWHDMLRRSCEELKKLPGNHWQNRIYKEITPWFAQPPPDDEQISLAFQKKLTDIIASPETRKKNKPLLDALNKICNFRGQAEKRAAEEEKTEIATMKKKLNELRKIALPKYPTAHGLRDSGSANMHVGIRGDIRKKGEQVPRRFLQILAGEKPALFTKGSGRLELAEAVVEENNPLTARVMVNRMWLNHFGKGLVRSPSNFGVLGEKPTHPELLDWLATMFIESGWSMKKMHKLIMTSYAWQMSSAHNASSFAIDGDNELIWRMNPRRLDVESWRDSLLAVTGDLDTTIGGKPSNNILGDKRRTLYSIISRNGDRFTSDEFLRMFNFPAPRSTSAKRVTSIVPQQYLFMMNSNFMLNRAKALAAKLQKEAPDDPARIDHAYQTLYNRNPSNKEQSIGLAFLSSKDNGKPKMEQYAQVLLSAHEFMYME